MRQPFAEIGGAARRRSRALLCAVAVALALILGCGRAVAAPAAPGGIEAVLSGIEAAAAADAAALPAVPAVLSHEWRSFDVNGSATGAVRDVAWVIGVTILALALERAAARGLKRPTRRAIASRAGSPSLAQLAALLLCDAVGVLVFLVVFVVARRHGLTGRRVSVGLAILALNVLLRWRVTVAVIGTVLRPHDPAARLVELSDAEALHLARFLSAIILAMIVIVGLGRYALIDEAGGAARDLGLINAVIVCGLCLLAVFRSRAVMEALIRGRVTDGVIAAVRTAAARAWVPTALVLIAGLLVFFVAGLSLGLLSYYYAVTSTLGIWFVLVVVERLSARAWDQADAVAGDTGALVTQTLHHMLRAVVLLAAGFALARLWIGAVHYLGAVAAVRAVRAADSAIATLFIADAAWQFVKLAIETHLAPPASAGDGEDGAARATRLQTALPFLRAALAIGIGVLAVLVILSRLGVDTAPLIAGAGVFGLAISFGSQSLVRDIISGLFFMWDDAFRVGEYIDTGRLRGTVEAMSIRSVKLRHHNGPLHTVPYGQLGAVSNMSRDWAILKFNLRLERGIDIELVRKTVKQIGIEMQEDPEIAAEVLAPLKLQGIAEFAETALVVRLKFTARPIKPSWIQREYLKRIYRVFADKGIAFASGALTLQTVLPPEAPPPILAAPQAAEALSVSAPAD